MGNSIPYTFLNEHYRCHPGIIQFNKEEIYDKDDEHEPLKIMSKAGDIETPIKVLWFDGDYCESCYKYENDVYSGKINDKTEENKHVTKRNRKQIQIFVEEELPELYRRLDYICEQEVGNEAYGKIESVCIISPFKGQLDAIKKAIEESGVKLETEIKNSQGEKVGKSGAYNDNSPAMLTIHKSQGQEFDIVYLLPVEDGAWEWPWSQGKRLVNVAASRAKKELRIIVSRRLMSSVVQESLGGNRLGCNDISLNADKEMFVQKMVEYCKKRNTYEHFDKIGKSGICGFPVSNYEFGFHKSKLDSIFDGALKQRKTEIKVESVPEGYLCGELEHIMEKAEFDCYAFEYAYPLKELIFSDESRIEKSLKATNPSEIDETWKKNFIDKISKADKKHFINNEYGNGVSHFDFVIYDKRTLRVVLVIEVDGAYHRFDRDLKNLKKHIWNDYCKNSIVRDLGGTVLNGNDKNRYKYDKEYMQAEYHKYKNYKDYSNKRTEILGNDITFGFLRLPTDGTTFYETDELKEKFCENKFSAYSRERHNQIVTIEDLIREYATVNEGKYLKLKPECITSSKKVEKNTDEGITISQVAKRLKSHGIATTAKKCNDILTNKGLIENSNKGKLVSDKGLQLGIKQDYRIDENGKEYIVPIYPEACVEKIIDILRENL